MRRLALVLPLVVASLASLVARARGDELELRERSLLDTAPVLELDPVLRPKLEGLGASVERERTIIPIGSAARVALEGMWWENADRDEYGRARLDLEGRGWQARLYVEHDLGIARLAVHASLARLDSRYGSGTYRDLGISLFRTFKLSRWMTGWIALSISQRKWLGDAPAPGEDDGTQATLSIGTTFR